MNTKNAINFVNKTKMTELCKKKQKRANANKNYNIGAVIQKQTKATQPCKADKSKTFVTSQHK